MQSARSTVAARVSQQPDLPWWEFKRKKEKKNPMSSFNMFETDIYASTSAL